MAPWGTNWPKYLALSLGVVVSGFGTAVLIAWYVHFIPLIQLAPDRPPLTREAALCHLLSGAALAFLAVSCRRAASVCAAIVFLLTVVVALEYFLDQGLGIDQLLGSGYIREGGEPPGRMSPIAALSYFLASLALLAMSIRRLSRYASAIAGIVASVLIAVGSVLFLVYRLAHMPTYGWGHFRHISIQASAVVALLGFGILLLALQENWIRRTPPPWLPLAVGLSLSAAALGIWQALLVHLESQLPLLSHIVLGGGILGALLVSITIHLAQKYQSRSRELQEGKSELEKLFEGSPDAIIVLDLAARITFWNRGAQDTYGWSAEEALGRVTHQLLQTRFPIPLREIQAAVLARGRWEGELEHTTRDGKTIVVVSSWSLRRDEQGTPRAFLEINRDVSLRKRAEDELRVQTQRLSLATRSASMGVWDWDLRTERGIWDNTMFQIYGVPKQASIRREDWVGPIHPDDRARADAFMETIIRGKTQDTMECRLIRPDGSFRHVSVSGAPAFDDRGGVTRVVGIMVDITQRKLLEAQSEAHKQQLVASARLSALGRMAGGVAHEINNPLAIIHAMASDLTEMAEEGSVTSRVVARKGAVIRQTAERVAKIVKSMRQISREGVGDPLRPTSLAKIVAETLDICRTNFEANGVELFLPHTILDVNVPCREVQIAQALLNLLQNAFDAVLDQEGERWVRLEVENGDDSVALSVTDSGPGIPPELRSRIGEPFFTTKPVGKGTGLGLSLSKTIAEDHGGSLEYSEDDGHTRFSLVLPVAGKEAA